ncbi:MAG: hypothetical protein NVV59_07950 [Chitinophagaceae bacterium]|nr:hypothetical protein [Chitinophagaceae bacterium]
MYKHLFSGLILGIFMFLASASKVNNFILQNFAHDLNEGSTDRVEMNDGRSIETSNMRVTGVANRPQVWVDGEKVSMKDVKGFRKNGVYYLQTKKHGSVRRVVQGTINVYEKGYVDKTTSTSQGPNPMRFEHNVEKSYYLIERNNSGEVEFLMNKNDIITAVQGCPLAVQMVDIKNNALAKQIKKNKRYLNEIFEVYNNDCKPLR